MKIAYRPNYRTLVSPTKGPQTLSAGSSTLAMLLAVGGVMALTATPAMAACDATAPVSDQTVTCDTSPPNPETNGIVIAAGTEDVKLIFLPGAILETSGGPAITIGTSNGAGSVNVSHDELFDNQGIIRTIGNHAPAIVVLPDPIQDFGQTTVVLTDVQFGMVETSGSDSPGIVYGEVGGGVGTDGSFVSVDIGATIATAGDRSPGLVNGGIGIGAGQMSDAFLGMAGHEYFVTTQGHDSAGVIFNMLGDTSGTQEILLVSNRFQADTVGDRSPGVIIGANRTATPDTLTSSFQATNLGAFVTTQGDDSVGFFFGPGATPSGDNFNLAAVAIHGTVVTSGDNSHGVIFTEGLSNAQPGTNVNITLLLDAATNFMTATTSGDNAHGIILGDGLGTNRTDMNFESALRIGNGWSATTSGASSHALVISENTTLTLDAANIGALTANGTVVNGTIGTFDGFVATGEGSRAVMNHGILYGTFTVGDDVVGNLGNNGLIESATGASGVAVQFTGTTNDFFELQTQGVVIGTVEAGAGTDTFILGGTGAASFDVGLIGTQYNDFEIFEKTGSSTWTLTGANAIAAPLLVSEGTLVVNAALENTAMTVESGATLAVENNGSVTADSGVTNFGLVRLSGGSLDANSLTNNDTGTLTGYGTVTPRPVNRGLIEATGGTVAMTGGIQGGSGTVAIQPDGALDLSSATQASSADFLNHQGTASDSLNLGNNSFVVSRDYTNAHTGTGNDFDARANVVGTGQIVGENAAMGITGDVTPAGANTVTLNLGNVRGGTSTAAEYQIRNTGTGADIRGAVQSAAGTGNLTDARLSGSGVTAQNFGPIEAGENGGNLSVTFTATGGGSLDGQTIGVVSNFNNVEGQTIQISGMASALAEGSATPVGPVNLGNFRVGQDGPSQGFAVENLTPGTGAEKLGIATAATTGNFAATNHLGAGRIEGGTSQGNALTAAVSGGTAGLNTGSLDIQYITDGTDIDASFTAMNSNTESIALSATGYRLAEATIDNGAAFSFGNVHVGGTVSQAVSISNNAVADGFSEGLDASFGTSSDTRIQNNGGTFSTLAAGATDTSSLVVNIDTSAAGAVSGTQTIDFASNGTGTSELGITALPSQDLSVSATIEMVGNVYRLASPLVNNVQPITFGNVREGDAVAVQAVSITNNVADDGFSEALNASVTGTSGGVTTNGGAFNLLAPQVTDNNSITVAIDTTTAGDKSGSATLGFVSDGEGSSDLGQTALASQNVAVSGAVYRLASLGVTPTPIVLNDRVGGSASQMLSVSNTAANDGFSEQLSVTGSTDAGDAVSMGAIGSLIDAGATKAGISVGLDTSTAGAKSGTVTFTAESDGTNTSGLTSNEAVAGATVNVSGNVWQTAVADVQPTSIDFGIVHVGDGVSGNVGVANTASGALVDVVVGGISTGSAGFAASGNLASGVASGNADNSSLVVDLVTSAAGFFNGTADVDLASRNPDLTDVSLGTTIVNLSAQVNNYANPWFALESGFGSLSVSGFDFVVDYGTLFDDFGAIDTSLSFSNKVIGPADLLRGGYDLTGIGTPFLLSGFGGFDDLAAGQMISGLSFVFNTSDLGFGSFQQSIGLNATGFNASGYTQDFDVRLTFQGQIRDRDAAAVNEPPVLLLMFLGLLALAGLRYRRASFR